MNVAVIVPFKGKEKYQKEYDAIVAAVEKAGGHVLSPENHTLYEQELKREAGLRGTPRAHYEFIRKSIIDSDAVIVEASWEDFRVGHETTLALLYRKPVLALSQTLDLGKYIHHPDFYGVKYEPTELPKLVTSFMHKVGKISSAAKEEVKLTNTTKTVAVFGGVYADIWNKVANIPHENEVALSNEFKITLGGKATNAAVALARMGNEVFICGRVGHDTLGNDLEAVLIHEGIKTDFLSQDREAGTGTVTLAVDERAKYSTIVHEAANVQITKESVDAVFRDVDAGRLKLDCVYLTLEAQREMVDYVIREAAKRELFIFCDAAPHVRPLDTALLPLVSIVAPNQLEALAITGIEVKNVHGAEKAAHWLLDHGAQQVLVTVGELGALYQKGHDRKFEPALSVKAIDEAGAGDAFRATFLHYFLRDQSIENVMRHAAAAGAYAVTHFGSYSSMPSESQLEDFIRTQSLHRRQSKVS